jgi:uncharacterized membrane protein SpoIIM required for sporulation
MSLAAPAPHDRSRDWERLRFLVNRAQGSGLASLDEQELWELPSLYRKAISDLSLLRSTGASPQLLQELNALCNRAHGVIYQGAPRRRQAGFGVYIARELPRAVRRRKWFVIAAGAVMAFFAALAWLQCSMQPDLARTVLSPRMLSAYETQLREARAEKDLALAAQIPKEERGAAAAMITINNIKVGVLSFVYGLAGGLPSLIIIGSNGYMLGAIAYLYFNTAPGIEINLPLYFIAGVAPHGAIELPAICLAGAAGMLIGFCWLFPGLRTRGEALREATRDAGRMVLTCALTLLVAGSIEGFVTPLKPPAGFPLETWFWLKIAVGALVFPLWPAWLGLGGRGQAQRQQSWE